MPDEVVEFLKAYNPDEARDDHGRWASGSAAGSALADAVPPSHGADVRATARSLGAKALQLLHDKAVELAGKAKQIIGGTRLGGVSPIAGGGVEIRGVHPLPDGRSHIATHIQLMPYNLTKHPALATALSAAHHGLVWSKRKMVAAKHPPIGATFRPGPAPS